MAKGGPSISVKMILTTTLLIVVTGVGAGLLNVMNIRKAFDESAAKQIDLFQEGRRQIGELGTPLFARATEALIVDKGRDREVKLLGTKQSTRGIALSFAELAPAVSTYSVLAPRPPDRARGQSEAIAPHLAVGTNWPTLVDQNRGVRDEVQPCAISRASWCNAMKRRKRSLDLPRHFANQPRSTSCDLLQSAAATPYRHLS